jgi:hypothetical protein
MRNNRRYAIYVLLFLFLSSRGSCTIGFIVCGALAVLGAVLALVMTRDCQSDRWADSMP